MKHNIGKLLFPIALVFIGIALIIFSYTGNQNWQFKLGSYATFIVGVFFILNILDVITKAVRLVVFYALVLLSLSLIYLDYKSIKDPIDFLNESQRRYTFVVQRLKDIRTAELAYKAVKGIYASDFDSLLAFVNTGTLPVVKAIGFVPDTLTEEQAVKMGLVRRDTSFVSVKDSIFSAFSLKDRTIPFYVDSLPFVPFGNGAKFDLKAGQIERNNVKVQVFEVIAHKTDVLNDLDPVMVKSETNLKVGSMIDPNTNGNWGE